jgi:uncharacterized DUF497 family protein
MDTYEKRFEWDQQKRLSNIDKHGIDFRRALNVFRDPTSFEYRSRGDHGEERCVLVGMTDDRLIAIVYVLRGPKIRIISARAARNEERNLWNASES